MAEQSTDSSVDLQFNDEKTQLSATFHRPTGNGSSVTIEYVMEKIHKMGVSIGIQSSAIEEAVKEVSGTLANLVTVVVAQGALPRNGTDAKVTWKIDNDILSKGIPRRPDGLIDYFAIEESRAVSVGQILASITSATPGTPGQTVTFPPMPVPPTPGKPLPFIYETGIKLLGDGERLVAIGDGYVELRESRLLVHLLHGVPGPLNGGVHQFQFGAIVHGDVNCRYIRANGVVAIEGTVSGTTIRTTGDVYITRAVGARVITEGSVYVLKSLEDCEINARRKLIALDGASFVGGYLNATDGVDAACLGSPEFAETHIHAGADLVSTWRRNELVEEIEECEHKFTSICEGLSRGGVQSAKFRRKGSNLLMQTLLDQKREIEERFRQLSTEKRLVGMGAQGNPKSSVTVAKVVHPGVWIEIQNAKTLIEVPQERVMFVQDARGKAVLTKPLGNPRSALPG